MDSRQTQSPSIYIYKNIRDLINHITQRYKDRETSNDDSRSKSKNYIEYRVINLNLESISNSGTRTRSTKYKEKLGATKTKKELKTEVIELRSNEQSGNTR